ncbi:TlpA family protein disulfide reductase [Larkinella soli]|uniref:TlpA family protein disulfide reductase n=1 Tax=Larkinella soli TaxID=1770527 RepID=UPI000FFB9412|nr:hypothetical protein [Larkinella soli]
MFSAIRILATVFLALFLFDGKAQSLKTVLCRTPESWNGREVHLVVSVEGRQPLIDTGSVRNGEVLLQVNLEEPASAYLWIEGAGDDIPLFLDQARTTVLLHPDLTPEKRFPDSPSTRRWQRLRSDFQRYQSKEEPWGNSITTDSSQLEIRRLRADSVREAYHRAVLQAIESEPESPVSWYLFRRIYGWLSFAQEADLLNRLATFSGLTSYQTLRDRIESKKPGRQIPRLALDELPGLAAGIFQSKSRYILIDLCQPWLEACRVGRRELEKVYEVFKPKGLEIITLAVEPETASPARPASGLPVPWRYLKVRPDRWQPIADVLAIDRSPEYVLLDRQGRVVAREPSAVEIRRRLEVEFRKRQVSGFR